ncbi:MAG: leucyl aminopeptidase [Rhodospirillaceae bacterium TMED8]|nr:leucyl aminopeptidase [Magnetovibrio sp.]OUT50862.1 MAG: leucyl aminopeptidase [Rhodospirillaceae bacterium TMED8]|tara:strand:- start:1559 stop:3052 length:1494 start_codon:yes stop_codon:yes gene_type:complete
MKIVFANPFMPSTGVAVVFATDTGRFLTSASKLDTAAKGALTRAVKGSKFRGRKGQSLTVMAPASAKLNRILLVGLGKAKDIDELAAQSVGGEIYTHIGSSGQTSANVMVDEIDGVSMKTAEIAANIAYGARLRSYCFDKYLTKKRAEAQPSLKTLRITCVRSLNAKSLFQPLNRVADGIFMARDLVSEPPNVIYPQSLAQRARELSKLGVKVEVLGEAKMRKLGMGALLGVGQGSARESQMVIMRWNGAGKDSSPIAFVGKGVTFDTGGISIKPAGGMEDMKWDMGGSGVVIGLMRALAGRKARVNVVGVVGLVENMPDGNAQRPGDIVTSMSGQTIEVINTDAEGRLVLADALHYTVERFKPKFIVDLATLTGAIIVSLADQYAGLFTNNDTLCDRLLTAGIAVNERLWRLPLGDGYDKMINSDAADMKNVGGRGGGSITAAQFLQRFIGATPWAHIDIAGVTWSKRNLDTVPKGGTAFGVRLLDRLVADYYEGK